MGFLLREAAASNIIVGNDLRFSISSLRQALLSHAKAASLKVFSFGISQKSSSNFLQRRGKK